MAEIIYRWPDWMGRPDKKTFRIEPVDTRAMAEMEVGTIARAEYDTDEQEATCVMTLDGTQAAWLEAFEHRVLHQGTKWFTFPCWISGVLQYRDVCFKSRPKLTDTPGLNSQYTFVLRVKDRDLWSEDVAVALIYYTPENLATWSDALDTAFLKLPGATSLPALPWS